MKHPTKLVSLEIVRTFREVRVMPDWKAIARGLDPRGPENCGEVEERMKVRGKAFVHQGFPSLGTMALNGFVFRIKAILLHFNRESEIDLILQDVPDVGRSNEGIIEDLLKLGFRSYEVRYERVPFNTVGGFRMNEKAFESAISSAQAKLS